MSQFTFAALLLTSIYSIAPSAHATDVVQTIQNNTAHFRGLDNPRQLHFNQSNTQAVAVSGDDNALVTFTINEQYQLIQTQVFQSTEAQPLLLTGASDAHFINDKLIISSSFYDGAVTLFGKDEYGEFRYLQSFSDEVSYRDVFDPAKDVSKNDSLGLFAPWKITLSRDKSLAFVPSYKSNAVAVFAISPLGKVTWLYAIGKSQAVDLGSPVDVLVHQNNQRIIVAGYEGNSLAVLHRNVHGEYVLKQRISQSSEGLAYLNKPQALVANKDLTVFYVAASGSNSILVFKQQPDKQYRLIQTINKEQVGLPLKGVSTLLLSPNNNQLYAASETSTGITEFSIAASGELTHTQNIDQPEQPLANISSMTFGMLNTHLVVSLAKQDTIKILKLRK
ncbi:beta-propeller fold lactonase family protein [Pseudoalteromonas piscicida]|uniref:beta-propeller fold lactonase family protein n=1 Tax=Pseudoalteromonas piscicida TaxID=43662 RepID=UPI0030A90129